MFRQQFKDRESAQAVSKPRRFRCMWGGTGSLLIELLSAVKTPNSDQYCQQFYGLKEACAHIVFHQVNARSHIALVTHQKLRKFGQMVLMHSTYSPDFGTDDCHLNLFEANDLGGFHHFLVNYINFKVVPKVLTLL